MKIILIFIFCFISIHGDAQTLAYTPCSQMLASLSNSKGASTYLRLVQFLALEKNAIETRELEHLERSEAPINPVIDLQTNLSPEQKHAYSIAFEKILNDPLFHWSDVKKGLSEIIKLTTSRTHEREEAKEDTKPIFYPFPISYVPLPDTHMLGILGTPIFIYTRGHVLYYYNIIKNEKVPLGSIHEAGVLDPKLETFRSSSGDSYFAYIDQDSFVNIYKIDKSDEVTLVIKKNTRCKEWERQNINLKLLEDISGEALLIMTTSHPPKKPWLINLRTKTETTASFSKNVFYATEPHVRYLYKLSWLRRLVVYDFSGKQLLDKKVPDEFKISSRKNLMVLKAYNKLYLVDEQGQILDLDSGKIRQILHDDNLNKIYFKDNMIFVLGESQATHLDGNLNVAYSVEGSFDQAEFDSIILNKKLYIFFADKFHSRPTLVVSMDTPTLSNAMTFSLPPDAYLFENAWLTDRGVEALFTDGDDNKFRAHQFQLYGPPRTEAKP